MLYALYAGSMLCVCHDTIARFLEEKFIGNKQNKLFRSDVGRACVYRKKVGGVVRKSVDHMYISMLCVCRRACRMPVCVL